MARSTFFYTDSRLLGGAEQAMFMLLGGLDRRRWAPTLLLDDVPAVEPLAERSAELGVGVRLVAPMPLGVTGARRVPALARLLRRERPDVFHAHLSWPLAAKYGLAAAVLARGPAVIATVQLIPEFRLERSSAIQLRALAAAVDRYIAVSDAMASELAERFRWPRGKIEVVYNAVDLRRFEVPEQAALRASLGGDPIVLTCARLDEQKGHPVLLRAAAQIPGASFVIAGEGPQRPALESLAAELGVEDRVRFLGERADVPELLAACDVFALPSLYEGSSLALLEAMAARRPVVSSAIRGTDELIEDGRSGILVPPGDHRALAGALQTVLGDARLRASLALEGRRRVEERFTRERMVRSVTAIYEEVLDDAG